jgi:hypothetical protein
MRTQRRCSLTGLGRKPEHCGGVLGPLGVVRESLEIRRTGGWVCKRLEGPSVQLDRPMRWKRLLDGETS